jgi:FdhD protein
MYAKIPPMKGRIRRKLVRRFQDGAWTTGREAIIAEEPLAIRLIPWGERPPGLTVAVTMRTPGHDFELAAGFLWTEGILPNHAALRRISYCVTSGEERYNIVNAWLNPDVPIDQERFRRHFAVSSSCGICGTASLDEVLGRIRRAGERSDESPPQEARHLPPERLTALPDRLREGQLLFHETGGLHGAGLIGPDGQILAIREDVGRHNAVDKLLGWALLSDADLTGCGLVLSGRISFDLMQKAAVAGVGLVVAVGAPSSLAVDLAEAAGISLYGWAREGRLTQYTP